MIYSKAATGTDGTNPTKNPRCDGAAYTATATATSSVFFASKADSMWLPRGVGEAFRPSLTAQPVCSRLVLILRSALTPRSRF